MFDSIVAFVLQTIYLLSNITPSNALDILLVAAFFFVIFQALHQTRSLQLLRGVIIIAVLGGTLLVLLPFDTLRWLVQVLLLAGVIALPLLFQDELRRALTGLGQLGRHRGYGTNFERFKSTIVTSVHQLAAQQMGALIVLEGQTPVEDVISTGIPLNADVVTPELLLTIFNPNTPLHDGAVVLSGDRLVAAGCILPIQTESTGVTHLGTRHRAGLGLSSRVPDAMVLIVSEETGIFSVVYEGRLHRGLYIEQLEDWLDRFRDQIAGKTNSGWRWLRGGGLYASLLNLLMALGLALIAWVSLIFQINPPQTHKIEAVPVVVSGPAQGLILMSDLVESVDVNVQVTQDRIGTLDTSSARAELSLADFDAGVHQVPIDITLADQRAQLLSVSPAFVNITLEPELTITLTPTVSIQDIASLPLGYVLDDVSLTPATISIRGPQSLVDQVAEARINLSLDGNRSGLQANLPPLLIDDQGETIQNLASSPEDVLVTVSIRRSFFTRDIPIQARLVLDSLESGYEVSQVTTSPSSLTIAGSTAALDAAGDYLVTAPITLTNIYSNLIVDAPLILPEGVAAIDDQGETINTVSVNIVVAPLTDYLVLNTKVMLRNIPESFSARVTTSRISVLVIGPQTLLAEIRDNPDLIVLYIDLSDFAAGAFTVPILIEAPEDIQVLLFPTEADIVIDGPVEGG
ncbi:diadenylate cyclase CdaA [Chloroflexota bacterium]